MQVAAGAVTDSVGAGKVAKDEQQDLRLEHDFVVGVTAELEHHSE